MRNRPSPDCCTTPFAATDSIASDKAEKLPWLERKTHHIERMAEVSEDAALVIACGA